MAKKTADHRAEVLARINAASPVDFLIKVFNGDEFECAVDDRDQSVIDQVRPTMEQRIKAATILLTKTLPDLRVAEVTGAEGGPIVVFERDFPRAVIAVAMEDDEDAPPVRH